MDGNGATSAVQSQYDTDFNQRMFIYHYRTFDLYRKPVISLAILGDEKENEQMAEERGLQQRIDQDKELIIRLIQKKLGIINEDLKTQVKALNIEDLETLAEDLFDLESMEDLQQWLSKF